MSANKHTPEPWRTDEECGFPQDIHDSKGILFLRCGSDFDKEIFGEANARRIVACVNACAALSDADLADIESSDSPIATASRILHFGLIKQRDKLSAQLADLRAHYAAALEAEQVRARQVEAMTAAMKELVAWHQREYPHIVQQQVFAKEFPALAGVIESTKGGAK